MISEEPKKSALARLVPSITSVREGEAGNETPGAHGVVVAPRHPSLSGSAPSSGAFITLLAAVCRINEPWRRDRWKPAG